MEDLRIMCGCGHSIHDHQAGFGCLYNTCECGDFHACDPDPDALYLWKMSKLQRMPELARIADRLHTILGLGPLTEVRCTKCGVLAAGRLAKYCGDGSDKDNPHRFERILYQPALKDQDECDQLG